MMTASALAQGSVTPEINPNHCYQHISPNGRYLVSELYGNLTVIDRSSSTSYDNLGDDTGEIYYTSGLGNSVSNNGIVLASTRSLCDASYWQNGQWHQLDTTGSTGGNDLANGITPDGSRICGSISAHEITISEDALMMVPVYWDRNADGSYSECKPLPHPTTDLLGRTPQYVTAISISDDGRTIIGQITDCSGFLQQPIVYTQSADGEWSYKVLLADQFIPEGLEIPADPGEGPAEPSKANFMSPEKLAEYEEAMNAWAASGYEGEGPNEDNYLTEEELEAYNTAYGIYLGDYGTWQIASEAFWSAMEQIVAYAPHFEFNNILISPDGSKYVTTNAIEIPDEMSWFPVYRSEPWIIDIAADKVAAKHDSIDAVITAVPNNETILAFSGVSTVPCTGYVITADKATPLHEYIAAQAPHLKQWIDENLFHTIELMNYETEEVTVLEVYYTGMPLASSDMKTLAFWTTSDWDYDYVTMGYVVDLSAQNSLHAVESPDAVKIDASGRVDLAPGVVKVEIYNPAGQCIHSGNGSEKITLDAPAGLYIVKATMSNGIAATAKIIKK